MKRIFVCLCAVAILDGCAVGSVPMGDAAKASIQGATVVTTTHETPSFSAMNPGTAMIAMVGAVVALQVGSKIVSNNQVEDPAIAVGRGVAQMLTDRYSAKVVDAPIFVHDGDADHIATAARAQGRYVVDVQTTAWMLIYYATDWTHYHVVYAADVRVIDTGNASVVASYHCKSNPDQTKDSPTYDEMIGTDAAGLKRADQDAAAACVKAVATEMLKA